MGRADIRAHDVIGKLIKWSLQAIIRENVELNSLNWHMESP